ncbi:MAG: peptidylprolyl isomerase [Candidatus Margulisiibacteriota bacterium]
MNDKYAVFETSKGTITCVLYPKEAPKTVENFIGLAKGEKEWLDPKTGKNSKAPLYNGTIFHRVIPDFMIQGGDPLGLGIGGPGYKFGDEFADTLTFDAPGKLAMANSGPNTNGSQFFITVVPTPWLTNHHTIFGQVVEGQNIVDEIVNVSRDQKDRPTEPVILKSVTFKETL